MKLSGGDHIDRPRVDDVAVRREEARMARLQREQLAVP
jgi:hypothetical protein